MKKLLFQTDSSLAKTGFGRNAKALLSYLYKTKKYDIHLSLSDDKPWAQATVIISYNK